MELNNYDKIKNLDTSSEDWKCRVRVQAFWKGEKRETKQFLGVNIIFIDDSNGIIHAFASAKYADELLKTITEGDIYILSNFKVKDFVGDETYRPVRNQKHIYFTQHTGLKKENNEGLQIENYAFDLFNMGDSEKLADDNRFLIDMVGKLQNLQPKITSKKNNVEKTLVKFEISDGRSIVKVTLFDMFGEKFSEDIKNNDEEDIYIIISCAKISRYEGAPNITNYPATRIYINPKHYSVEELKLKLKAIDNNNQSRFNEPVNKTQKNIKEIRKLTKEFSQTKVFCQVKVKKVDDKASWYYCKCTGCETELTSQDGIYKCEKCNRIIPHPDKRFRLCTLCSDKTGSIAIIFPDSEICRMIDTTVFDIQSEAEENEEEKFPQILKQFVNQEYIVTLEIKEDNVLNGSTVYDASEIIMVSDQCETFDPANLTIMQTTENSVMQESYEIKTQTPQTANSSNKSRARKNCEPISYEENEASPPKMLKNIKIEKK